VVIHEISSSASRLAKKNSNDALEFLKLVLLASFSRTHQARVRRIDLIINFYCKAWCLSGRTGSVEISGN